MKPFLKTMNIYSLNIYSLWIISLTSKYKKELLFNYMVAEIFFPFKDKNCFASFSRGVVSKMGLQIEHYLHYLSAR